MESIMIPRALHNRLNTFQLEGLRKILGMRTTFIDRTNTNKKVFERANHFLHKPNAPERKVTSFSEYVQVQQNKLLAHIVRSPNHDPLRQCTLTPNSPFPAEMQDRRVGRPRQNWAWHCYGDMFVKNSLGTKDIFKIAPEDSVRRVETKIRDRTVIL